METLREKNTRVLKRVLENSKEMKNYRESFKRQFAIDPFDGEKFPVLKEGWSWSALKDKLSLKEADVSSSFVQFLRAGVQTITNAMYEATPTTFEEWVTVVQSNKDTELYAPNQGVAFPRQVGPSEIYPEVGVAALDLKLKNLKFGAIYALERELLEDDQTGSFQQQAGLLGQYMKVLAEVLVMGKLASASSMKYIDYSIPVSETQPSAETTWPWSTALVGGGRNRPDTFVIIKQSSIQDGIVGLMNQKNLQGIKMMVNPDKLIVGPTAKFDSSVLLHSAYFPTGATAGAVGGTFSINPIQGVADLVVSRFMFKNDGTVTGDSKAWYLVDSKKPWFVLQMRESVSVEQEAINSGDSFNKDHIRFKARSRMNADFIDPRFAWQGNDGSITS